MKKSFLLILLHYSVLIFSECTVIILATPQTLYGSELHYSSMAHIREGSIVDALTNEAISHVRVSFLGSASTVTSDKNGRFTFRLPDGSGIMKFVRTGYETVYDTLDINQYDSLPIIIQMIPTTRIGEEVVVSGNRTEQLYSDAPIKVNILKNIIFEQTQSVNILEGLRFQPGLRIENSCQNCGASNGPRINGMEGAYTQILIDSRPVFSALNAVYGLELLPAAMIDRVEIIRGGGSSLFGANAIAGTVNIITKEPTQNTLSAMTSIEVLSQRSVDRVATVNGSIVNDNLDFGAYFFAAVRNRDSYDANNDGYSEISKLQTQSIGMRGFWNPTLDSKVQFGIQNHCDKRRGGNRLDVPAHQADIAEQISHNVTTLSTSYEHYLDGKNIKLSAYGSATSTLRESYYGTNRDPNAYGTSRNMIGTFGAQCSSILENSLVGNGVLVAGIEYTSDKLNDVQERYKRSITQDVQTMSAYAQYDWIISNDISIVTGVRADKNSFLSAIQVNPRLSLHAKFSPSLIGRVSYSTGFRPPTTFSEDLHISLVAGEARIVTLSPALQSEQSQNITASIEWNTTLWALPFSLSVDLFSTQLVGAFVEEFIGYDSDSTLRYEKVNGGGLFLYGTTWEIKTAVDSWLDVRAGMTIQHYQRNSDYQWGTNETAITRQFLRAPNAYGYWTMVAKPLENTSIVVSGVYTGSMAVAHIAGYIPEDRIEQTNDFVELNMRIEYTPVWLKRWSIFSGVRNCFNHYQQDFDKGIDRDAAYVYGPMTPRSVYVGLKLQMD